MVVTPVFENDYYDSNKSLYDSKNTFVGPNSFRFNATTSKERI